MMRSCIRQAVRAFAGAAIFSCALAAQAGGITLSDSNCDSFSLSGPAGNQVLTCVVSNAPSGCSIQGPSTGTNGVAITLTAVCSSGSPTSYAWTGGNCQGTGNQSCQAIGNNATVTYGVTPSNGIGPGNTATKQVVWSASLPVKPSGCSITPSPGSLPAGGGSVSLTAQCSGGDGVDSWNWGGANYTMTSGNTASATISSTTTFTISPTNGGGSGSAQATVNVGGGGGGGGPISCSGFLNTSVLTLGMPIDANRTLSMGVLDAGVVQFTPASGSTSGQITVSNAGNNATTHHDFVLSSQPCDFVGIKQFINSGAPTIRFTVSPSGGSGANLKIGQTYYINVRNNATSGCAANGDTIGCSLYPVSSKP
jgi:hypothetical protein